MNAPQTPDRPTDTILLDFVRDRDVACPGCEYNVRNLTRAICPECGESLQLQVGLVEQKQAGVIAGLIGLAAGAGFNGLLLCYMVMMVLIRQQRSPFVIEFLLYTGIPFAIFLLLLWIWLRNWKRIRRLATGSRMALVLLAWSLVIVDLLVFSFAIR